MGWRFPITLRWSTPTVHRKRTLQQTCGIWEGMCCVECLSRGHMKSSVRFLCVLLAFVGAVAAANSQEPSADATVASIRAMPFYTQTGTIRRTTDLFDPRLALRNVIIGTPSDRDLGTPIEEWDIQAGTTITYVEVAVSVTSTSPERTSAALEFVARAGTARREIARQRVALREVSAGRGLRQVPFLVYGTGCETVELSAQILTRGGRSSALRRTIPFTCGE